MHSNLSLKNALKQNGNINREHIILYRTESQLSGGVRLVFFLNMCEEFSTNTESLLEGVAFLLQTAQLVAIVSLVSRDFYEQLEYLVLPDSQPLLVA